MKRTVTVLQDDIDHGIRREPGDCPIARAVKRDLADLIGETMTVGVSSILTLWSDAKKFKYGMSARLPGEAATFICLFDNRVPVEPFKFEIELETPPGKY